MFHNFTLGSGNEVLSCSDHDAKLSSSRAGDSPWRGAPRQQLAWHIRPLQQLHTEGSTLCGERVRERGYVCGCPFRFVPFHCSSSNKGKTERLFYLNLDVGT